MRGTHPRFYYGWVIVGVVLVVNTAANATASFTFGLFVIPMSDDLGISRGLIGWIPTARLAGAGASAFLLGRVVDRFGARMLLPVAAVITALTLYGVAQANAFVFVIILFGILGLVDFSTPGNVLTSVPIAKWFVRLRGRATAIVTLGFAAGGAGFALMHQQLIDAYGWRTTFAVSGVIVVVMIMPVALLLLRRQPEDLGLLPDGAAQSEADGEALSPAVAEEQWTLREARQTASFWKVAIAYGLINFSTIGFIIHRAAYWTDGGIATGLIAWGFVVDSAGFAVSALVAGFLIERVPARMLGTLSALGQATAIVLALAWFSPSAALVVPLIFGLAAGTGIVVQTVIWADYYGREHQGAIRGFVVPIALIGMGLGPPAIGMLYDAAGGSYITGFWLAFALLAGSAAVLFTAKPPKKARVGVGAKSRA